jgi:hypothetical protein
MPTSSESENYIKRGSLFFWDFSHFSLSLSLFYIIMEKTLDYTSEPPRDRLQLIVRKDKPFNAEPNLPDLVEHPITPLNRFFCRNHGPLPLLDDNHTISIGGVGLATKVLYTVKQLKDMFHEKTIEMVMQVIKNSSFFPHLFLTLTPSFFCVASVQ